MKWLEVCSYWNLLSVSWSALFMLAGDAEQPSLSSPIFHLLFSMFLPFLCHLMQLKDTGKPNCPLLDTFYLEGLVRNGCIKGENNKKEKGYQELYLLI